MYKPRAWHVLVWSACLIVMGCQTTQPESAVSSTHPAHPEALAAQFEYPSLLLSESVAVEPAPAPAMQHDHHMNHDDASMEHHHHEMKPAAKDSTHHHHEMKPAAKDSTHHHHGGHG